MPNPDAMFKFFVQYNLDIWPAQIVGYLLYATVLFVVARRFKYSDQTIAAILALNWLWLGIRFFVPAGAAGWSFYFFAVLFVIEGVLFAVGATRPFLSFRFSTDVYSLTGLVLIAYAAIIYPLVGFAVGHVYPLSLTLGAFPCPTTIFTLGLFLCSRERVPWYLLIAPGLFALTGVTSPGIGIVEDAGLFIAGLIAVPMLLYRDRRIAARSALRPVG
ncbi:MAG: DUF6064 family protein [Rudaea sp.]